MLLQSTLVAEVESRRHYKAEQHTQAQDKAEAQRERDNPRPAWGSEDAYFDCHVDTVEMQAASAPGASQQEWHEVHEMPQEQVSAASRWELETKARQKQPQQSLGHTAEDRAQEPRAGEAAQSRQTFTGEGMQDEESINWSKVEQAAEVAASPQDTSKKACRIHARSRHGECKPMAGSGSNRWVCIGTWCRSSRHCHGCMVG